MRNAVDDERKGEGEDTIKVIILREGGGGGGGGGKKTRSARWKDSANGKWEAC